MTQEMKLFWKLYFEWFPNERILSRFSNGFKDYTKSQSGRVMDIGCGQSAYVLDLLDSDFELFAVDTDADQLGFLKERVSAAGYGQDRVRYHLGEFSPALFGPEKFTGIILSNLLHFFPKEEAFDFARQCGGLCEPGALMLVTVHSGDHLSAKEELTEQSYFKSFYFREDLRDMFPVQDFEPVSCIERESLPDTYTTAFLKHWLEENFRLKYSPAKVSQIQQNYLARTRTNSIEFLVRKR